MSDAAQLRWTPGPWRPVPEQLQGGLYHIAGRSPSIMAEGGRHIADAIRFGGPSDGRRSQAEANACLIAAAPELYEALNNLLAYHNDGRIPERVALSRAEAAIAKACGETV